MWRFGDLKVLITYHLPRNGMNGMPESEVDWLVAVADHLPKRVARNYEGIAQEYLGASAAHVKPGCSSGSEELGTRNREVLVCR